MVILIPKVWISILLVLFTTVLNEQANANEFGTPVILTDSFKTPSGLGIDPGNAHLLVADTGNHRIKYAVISTLADTPKWSEFGFTASRNDAAALNEPQAISGDVTGNVYVVDTFGNEVQLYRWNASSGSYKYDSNFVKATRNSVGGKSINRPRDIAVGSDNKVFLLDSGNRRILVADGPDDDSWEVWREDNGWANPYGLDIAKDGTVYLADTDHHRILKLLPAGGQEIIGSYGTGNQQFRFPRDVAVGSDGRLFVADTDNNRVEILNSVGKHYRFLATAPLLGTPQKVVIDAENHVFIVDAENNRVVAFLGPTKTLPFDAYIRDYVGDSGEQPSDSKFVLSSPDILIRHNNDVDHVAATSLGLLSYVFQQPLYDANNYVYLAIRNRGSHGVAGVMVKLFWGDASGQNQLNFPSDWKSDGFFSAYASNSSNSPSNSIIIPYIEPRKDAADPATDGVVVVGPIIWRPPEPPKPNPNPETPVGPQDNFYLFARLVLADDPSESADGLEQVRKNNNIALRPTQVTRSPFPIGDQDTLVIRVNFKDVNNNVDEKTVNTRITEASNWLEEVSYRLTKLKPALYENPIVLDKTESEYTGPDQNLLVEMTTEVLGKIDAKILDGPTTNPKDDIDRIVLVLNDTNFDKDYATTGTWPYEINGQTRYLSVSIQGPNNSTSRYTHGLLHQFGLNDLYIYDNVQTNKTYWADGWDNMAKPLFNGAHPLVWSKQFASWVTESGGKILYIPRPAKGTTVSKPVTLSYQSILKSGQYGAIAIGLTEKATTFESESQFYWIEARNPNLTVADPVPSQGVLAYYANKLIPQGQGPVIVRNYDLTQEDLSKAVIPVNQSMEPPGTGIKISVNSELPSDGGYTVNLDYTPPATDYDVFLRPGDPPWESPDVWIDNQRDNGGWTTYTETDFPKSVDVNSLPATPSSEPPLAGTIDGKEQENRIYARVYNRGPADAYDIEVHLEVSEPGPSLGQPQGNFIADNKNQAPIQIPVLPQGMYKDVFFTWKPKAVNDPHNCARVEIRNAFNDSNEQNNSAQRNFQVEYSTRGSPYEAVSFPFQIKNAEPKPQLVYFQKVGIPPSWSQILTPAKRLLLPDETLYGKLTVNPPETAAVCTDHPIQVTAWTPRGDTLVRLGGATVSVDLRNRTLIDTQGDIGECSESDRAKIAYLFEGKNGRPAIGVPNPLTDKSGEMHLASREPCNRVHTKGCTNPPRPNEKIILRYSDPSGNPVYHEVTTDEHGCYEDFNVVVEGGDWDASAYYPGNQCNAPVKSQSTVVHSSLPQTGDQDNDGLIDPKETQGDTDGDKLIGSLDPDSDNDGVIDGKEPPGDCDKDGLLNVIDSDSDNDGIPDGKDPFPCVTCHVSKHSAEIARFVAVVLWILAALLLLIGWYLTNWLLVLVAAIVLAILLLVTWFYCLHLMVWPAVLALIFGISVTILLWKKSHA